jgi:hypothetical protein
VVIAEKALISQIRRLAKAKVNPASFDRDWRRLRPAATSAPRVKAEGRKKTLVTTDFSLEGIHFRRTGIRRNQLGTAALREG